MPPLIDFLSLNGEKGIDILKNIILKLIEKLAHPQGLETKEINYIMNLYLFKNFINTAKNIIPTDKENFILNKIMSFGFEKDKNIKFILNHKLLSINCIGILAKYFGEEKTFNFLLPRFGAFSQRKKDGNQRKYFKCSSSYM